MSLAFRLARILELRRQGKSYETIAAELGVSGTTVSNELRQHAPELRGYRTDPVTGKTLRGFSAMDPAKRAVIAASGGAAGAPENRSFHRDRGLAVSAGRKGGEAGRRDGGGK